MRRVILSSTNRGYERHKSDYYVTPQHEIVNFLNHFKRVEDFDFDNILDPCAGGDESHEMSYPEALSNFGLDDVTTVDIREDSKAEIIADYRDLELDQSFDLIITNPPFKIARDIIEKGFEDLTEDGFLIMLLRLNYFGSRKRFDMWQNFMPKYTFVHHKRLSFTDGGGTDSIEYAHFVWQNNKNPDFTKLKVI